MASVFTMARSKPKAATVEGRRALASCGNRVERVNGTAAIGGCRHGPHSKLVHRIRAEYAGAIVAGSWKSHVEAGIASFEPAFRKRLPPRR